MMTKDEYQHYMDLAVKANEKMYRQMKNEARDEGKTIGIAEGKTIGIAEGEAIGIAKDKMETARKMKECNESVDKIKLYTGLSIEKIKSISI